MGQRGGVCYQKTQAGKSPKDRKAAGPREGWESDLQLICMELSLHVSGLRSSGEQNQGISALKDLPANQQANKCDSIKDDTYNKDSNAG